MIETTKAYGLTFAFPAGDDAVGACLRDHGEFARPECDFLIDQASIERGVFLDVGANIGAICLPFAAERPSWSVVALEAQASLAGVLTDNARLNGLANLEVLWVAAGAEAGVASFPDAPLSATGNFGNLGFGAPARTYRKVGVTALDARATPDVRLVKMDIQGHEAEALKGAARLRREIRPIWLVEATQEWPDTTAAVIEMLSADGYRLFWFFSPFATPSAPRGRTLTPGKGDASVVALPPGVENNWNLPPVLGPRDTRPSKSAAYPYLARYGYAPSTA